MADKYCNARLRIAEFKRVLLDRCGTVLPDADDGREYARLMIDHLMHLPDGTRAAARFVELWCPWMGAGELEEMTRAAAIAPRWWRADEFGHELNLTFDDRRRLGITTIAPADLTGAALEARKQQIRNERERVRKQKLREKLRKPAKDLCPSGLSPRQLSLLSALGGAYQQTGDICSKIKDQRCWRDGRGFPLTAESLRKIVRTELGGLVAAGLAEEGGRETTKYGKEARQFRLASNSQPPEKIPASRLPGSMEKAA